MLSNSDVALLRFVERKSGVFVSERYIELYAFVCENESDLSWGGWVQEGVLSSPCSENVRSELEELADNGFLLRRVMTTFGGSERVKYCLVDDGVACLENSDSIAITAADGVMDEWSDLPLSNLIDEVAAYRLD